MRRRDDPTTKGWNGYSKNERRDFKYLTPKIRIAENDLSPELLSSKSFHMVCSQERAIDLVNGILSRRKESCPKLDKPIFIYEPSPDCAVPNALEETMATIQYVDVLSPNHSELAHLFNRGDEVHEGGFKASVVEECTQRLLDYATQHARSLSVIVRSGKEGCYIASNDCTETRAWLPPYHQDQVKVVDPTGGGNGFLGGFGVGLVRTGSIIEATAWGSISASFCIEQVGIPVLGHDTEGLETWNDANPQQRLADWKKRIHRKI